MSKIVTLSLAAIAALTFSSCTCPNCQGTGMQVAAESGVHPVTGVAYKAKATIPCLRCGGSGTMTSEVLGTINDLSNTVSNVHGTVRQF